MSKVTVIIPTYNSGSSLPLSMNSAFRQTYPPLEIIVVDDGSEDNTQELVRRYRGQVRYVRQENQGQGAARNKGLAIAKGDYIAFLDADDYWKPEFLENCLEFLGHHEGVVAVSTALIIKNHKGEEEIAPRYVVDGKHSRKPFVIEKFFKFWGEYDHVRTGSNVIRKTVIDEAGFQRADLRVSQDLEYWGYIATFGKWGFIPKPLWVGNSRAAARKQGWLEKYQQRRRLCPTVESWEERIVPRLTHDERFPFSVIRGRVAAGYMHNKLLAGESKEALEIFRKYGKAMPRNKLIRLVSLAEKAGRIGWAAAVLVIKWKESLKS